MVFSIYPNFGNQLQQMSFNVSLTDEEKVLFEEFLAKRQGDLLKQLEIVKSALSKLQGNNGTLLPAWDINHSFENVAHRTLHSSLKNLEEAGWREKIDEAIKHYGEATTRQIIDFLKQNFRSVQEKDEETVMRSVTSRLSTLSSAGRYSKYQGEEGRATFKIKDLTKG